MSDGKDLATELDRWATLAGAAAEKLAPSAKAALGGRVAQAVLRLAAGIARGGKDPVEHLTRLVDLDKSMSEAKAEVDAEVDAKFGQ